MAESIESTKKTSGNAARVSPETVMRIKDLELRAKIVVEGFMSGLHRSPYHGFSVEFTDYRQYSPGDDLRYLDWKLLARQDRQYIKRFEDETNLRCYLLVDLSRSMRFGSLGYSKADYAKTMAATFAYFLNQQRDAVGLLTFADRIGEMIPPRFRAGHLRRLMMGLEHATVGTSTDLATPLEQIAQTVTKRGMIVLVSDLLAPVDHLKKNLRYLRSQGHDVVILRTLDPQEIDFQFSQASMFHDMESGREIYVDPKTVADDYRRRFSEHEQEIRKTCDQLGVDFFSIGVDEPLEVAMFDLIQARVRRGREIKRSTGPNVRSGA